ncbi:hypothetical protein BDV96DRAFT_562339 [Lophiotrema nucula]|uniref:EGF-like domain-containing protein n=1 Tax=Lophiotrema nucula TaxID=690887 RepID=A0A6A5ZQ05_9PLEO|nr:hypothetical protein BDV96DRAFT_562339 [Lophiotrema nucula]
MKLFAILMSITALTPSILAADCAKPGGKCEIGDQERPRCECKGGHIWLTGCLETIAGSMGGIVPRQISFSALRENARTRSLIFNNDSVRRMSSVVETGFSSRTLVRWGSVVGNCREMGC